MANIEILNDEVRQFSRGDFAVKKARDSQGNDLFVKIMSIRKIDELGIAENLDFNKCVMGDIDSMLFRDNLLRLEQEISSSTMVGFMTRPYDRCLYSYVKQKRVQEKEALMIFDEIVKGVYSLYLEEFLTRQVRSDHIVYSDGHWRLATLIFSHDSKSSKNESEYLWSNRHEAPQCSNKSIIADNQFQSMIVWNLGCILLEMLLQNHKFPTKEAKNKIKDRPFSFKGFGLKEKVWRDFSPQIEEVLQQMLTYDPKKRMTLGGLFRNQFLSPEVAKHYNMYKPNKSQKIVIGKSSVRVGKVNESHKFVLHAVEKAMDQQEKNYKKNVNQSIVSILMPKNQVNPQINPNYQNNPYVPEVPTTQNYQPNPYLPVDAVDEGQIKLIQEALSLYKSFYDESQLLNISLEVIREMEFPRMKPNQVRELQLLIQYSVTLVSLINLNALSSSLNLNINLLELEGDLYTAFAGSPQCLDFKKCVNVLKNMRSEDLNSIKRKIDLLNEKPLIASRPFISELLKANFETNTFKDIKTAYRFIVKHAYDSISQQYNANSNTERGGALARTAIYVTYCLTIDKLYIKEDINDNFKFFFEWAHIPESNTVPLDEFRQYMDSAPKQTLIKHSRYILKKYYQA